MTVPPLRDDGSWLLELKVRPTKPLDIGGVGVNPHITMSSKMDKHFYSIHFYSIYIMQNRLSLAFKS